MMPDLVFCAGNNRPFCEIALSAGYLYGARLPSTIYAPLFFADQDWKHPNRHAYMAALEKYRPTMASVIDWETPEQLAEVIDWAHEAAKYVDVVMIVPKVSGGVRELPRSINGKPVRVGYSVPTKHGGSMLFLSEFVGWPVHLLGGSPAAQMKLARYLDVVSADGNMSMKMANRGLFWSKGVGNYSNRWISLRDCDGQRWPGNGNQEAFRRSCNNIMSAWAGTL